MVNKGIYDNNFSKVFSDLIKKSGTTRYQIHKFTGIDQAYLKRLWSGEKQNPSPGKLYRISLALMHFSYKIEISDIQELYGSVGRILN
jgi:transcriptional regulator with XRE-family HTH domain